MKLVVEAFGFGFNPYPKPIRVWEPLGFTKPTPRTRENPHPWLRVWVSTGTGAGCPGKPQGCPSHSLQVCAGVECINW